MTTTNNNTATTNNTTTIIKESENKKMTANKKDSKKATTNKKDNKKVNVIKAKEAHTLVYNALDRKNDLFVLETEKTARNTSCDVANLACNNDTCSIIVKNNTTCVRRFVEIWGHTNYVDVVVKKRERETLFDTNKSLAKKFSKFEYEKKKNVFKLDIKNAIAFIQLLIDTSIQLDSKEAEKKEK